MRNSRKLRRLEPLRPATAQNQVLHRALAFGPHADIDRAGIDPLSQVTDTLTSPGRPLESATRTDMESRFGYDFANVRVHTDDKAARSARAIDAASYTAGSDIAFGQGQYSPGTPRGRQLLAHELTHVAQQNRAPAEPGLSIAPTDSPAEREADTVSAKVAGGGVLDTPLMASRGGIQRSVGGIVGGVIGGLVGAALIAATLEVLLRDARPLTPDEIKEARKVFGNSLNYGLVRIAESTVMTIGPGRPARTPFNTIFFPPGTQKKYPGKDLMPWLIHEMTHTWQTQHGISVVEKTITALGGEKAYKYGDDQGLKDAWAAGKHFLAFNTEQQADICSHYYSRLEAGGDTSPFDPYIEEVKHDGLPVNKRREIDDGVMPSGPNMLA
jgi:hypothetical protein